MSSVALLLLIASAAGTEQGCPVTGSAVLWAYDLCLCWHETDDALHPGVQAWRDGVRSPIAQAFQPASRGNELVPRSAHAGCYSVAGYSRAGAGGRSFLFPTAAHVRNLTFGIGNKDVRQGARHWKVAHLAANSAIALGWD